MSLPTTGRWDPAAARELANSRVVVRTSRGWNVYPFVQEEDCASAERRPVELNARAAAAGLCCEAGMTRVVRYAFDGWIRIEVVEEHRDSALWRASLSEQDLLDVGGASDRAVAIVRRAIEAGGQAIYGIESYMASCELLRGWRNGPDRAISWLVTSAGLTSIRGSAMVLGRPMQRRSDACSRLHRELPTSTCRFSHRP